MVRDKLNHLSMARDDIGEEAFKFAAATIIAKHYASMLTFRAVDTNRMAILERVNLTLRGFECEEVSYGFSRKSIRVD